MIFLIVVLIFECLFEFRIEMSFVRKSAFYFLNHALQLINIGTRVRVRGPPSNPTVDVAGFPIRFCIH